VTFRYFRTQRLGTVQMGHVPPYILNTGGVVVSDLLYFSGSFSVQTVIDPEGPTPTTLTNTTSALQGWVSAVDRNTLAAAFAYKCISSISNYGVVRHVAVPFAGALVHIGATNFRLTAGVLNLFDAGQVLDGTFTPKSDARNIVSSTWWRYDQDGNYLDANFHVNKTPLAGANGWYGLYSNAVRDGDDSVIHVNHQYLDSSLDPQDQEYADGQPADLTYSTKGASASVVLSKMGASALVSQAAGGFDRVAYIGTGGGPQLLPMGASRKVKEGVFAWGGAAFRAGQLSAAWTFNEGRATAKTMGFAAPAINTLGFVAKYEAADLEALWWVSYDNGTTSSLFGPWNQVTAGIAFYQGNLNDYTLTCCCDVVEDGSVIAGGAVRATATSLFTRNTGGLLATTPITVTSGTAPTGPFHGYISKISSDGAALDWIQVIRHDPLIDRTGPRAMSTRVVESENAVFVVGFSGTRFNVFADAGNAGNSYTPGGAVTTRTPPDAASASTGKCYFIIRYNLTTGAMEGIYTWYALTGDITFLTGGGGMQWIAGALTDVYNGLLVYCTSSNGSAIELDTEGPDPQTIPQAPVLGDQRFYLLKFNYDLTLAATNGRFLQGTNSFASLVEPLTLL